MLRCCLWRNFREFLVDEIYYLPKVEWRPENDGFQVRNLLFDEDVIFSCDCLFEYTSVAAPN